MPPPVVWAGRGGRTTPRGVPGWGDVECQERKEREERKKERGGAVAAAAARGRRRGPAVAAGPLAAARAVLNVTYAGMGARRFGRSRRCALPGLVRPPSSVQRLEVPASGVLPAGRGRLLSGVVGGVFGWVGL